MIQSISQNEKKDTKIIKDFSDSLEGLWKFDEPSGNLVFDSSGNHHTLRPTGNPSWVRDTDNAGIVMLNGATQWLGADKSVLRTDKCFSVAAWVRLDSIILNQKLSLQSGEHALTAASQDSPTHSSFYLGARRYEDAQSIESTEIILKWNFTISQVIENKTGVVEWLHVYSETPLNDSILDNWVLLVGVCDTVNRSAHIYVPGFNDSGVVYMPDGWSFGRAEGGFQVGRGLWLGRYVDQWPGSIGPIRAFSRALSPEDVERLYRTEFMMMSSGNIGKVRS